MRALIIIRDELGGEKKYLVRDIVDTVDRPIAKGPNSYVSYMRTTYSEGISDGSDYLTAVYVDVENKQLWLHIYSLLTENIKTYATKLGKEWIFASWAVNWLDKAWMVVNRASKG